MFDGLRVDICAIFPRGLDIRPMPIAFGGFKFPNTHVSSEN